MENKKKIPVILDTDIGSDIDDTWALCMMLRSPELDVKYIVTSQDDTVYKTKLTAKILDVTGNSHIPVGVGVKTSDQEGFKCQEAWVGDYDYSDYPGSIIEDGVQGIIDTVMASDEKVTVIAIGPVINIALALEREPRIGEKIRLVGVLGSIYRGHDLTQPQSEYNLRCHISKGQELFSSGIEVILVPLDVTANIVLDGNRYARLLERRYDDVYVKAIMENFDAWMVANNATYYKTQSTCLYDTAAIYRVFADEYFISEDLPINLCDDGFTRIDHENGVMMNCAVEWKDKEGFYDFVTSRLLGEI